MAKYETMLVTSAKLDEEANQALVGKFTSLIAANGSVDAVDPWGKRRLAYPIQKEEEGVYTLIYFTAEEDFPAELDRQYHITDGVLRTLIIAREPDAEVPAIPDRNAGRAPKAVEAAAPVAAPAAEAAEAETEVAAAVATAPAAEDAAEEAKAVAEETIAVETAEAAEEANDIKE